MAMIRKKLGVAQSEPTVSDDYFVAPLQELLAKTGKYDESKEQEDKHQQIVERYQSKSTFFNTFQFRNRENIGCIKTKSNDQDKCDRIEALELELSEARGIQFKLEEGNNKLSNDIQCLIKEKIALNKESERMHEKNQYQESVIQEICKKRDELSLQLKASQEEIRTLSDSNAYSEKIERYKFQGRLMKEENLNQKLHYEQVIEDFENTKSHWMEQAECLMKDNDDYREKTQQMIYEAERLRGLVNNLTTKREASEIDPSRKIPGIHALLRFSSYRDRNISPQCPLDPVSCAVIGTDEKYRENAETYEADMKTGDDVVPPLNMSPTMKGKNGTRQISPGLAAISEAALLEDQSSGNRSNEDTAKNKWINPPFFFGRIRARIIASKTA